ncbi:hypothetical protein PYW07_009954 [Mythimna separata]|uniref:Uncharacterized protein n=1 Tax=Mythimna separata TaxID=271217 RepID=A0AAD8DQ46_MYTSE|nr:hypothetical protein PYW07_009954 [Mythimna separata]
MSRILSLIYVTVLLLDYASCEEGSGNAPEQTVNEKLDILNPDIENALKKIDTLVKTASKLNELDAAGDVTLAEDPESIYDDMIKILNEIIEVVKNSNNAYKFLKANGLDRVVQQSLKANYDKLKTRTLILLKVLFDVAPTTTSTVIPITVIDKVLDIFEHDNLALKAHSLDVMYLWLPDNPKVQARVMKIKGLAPFYEQVAKLDMSVVKTLLDLFNIILKEHIKVNNDVQRTVVDSEKFKFYQRIGLLEHMKTPVVCNGLLNIFSKAWTDTTDEHNIIATVFDMVKNIKPFCLKIYRGKDDAKKLFMVLKKYVKDPENLEYFESRGLNVTEISQVIEEYVKKLRFSVKDEM